VSTRIKCRVSQHRYTIENDAIKKSRATDISTTTSFEGLSFAIIEENGSIFAGPRDGTNCIVGTHHGAHTTTDATFGGVSFLPQACKGFVIVSSFLAEHFKLRNAFTHMGKVNSTFGADSSTLPAKGTPFFPMFNYPRKVGRS
jgi:hypothetical protein